MPLSEDQKAMLRLLAQRGEQGYEDLAALLGVEAGEVHERAKAAAAELEREGIPAPAIPDPPGAATQPEPRAPAKPAEPAPQPPRPEPPAQPERPTPRAPQQPAPALPPGERQPMRARLKLLENRGLWAILAGAAIVVVFVVIVFVSDGDGDDSSRAGNGSGQNAAANTPVTKSKEVTKAVLEPVDGGSAAGEVIFGREKSSLALLVQAKGLAPTAKGSAYTIWLAKSPQQMLPLASTEVGKSGKINAQFVVPVEVLAFLANETFGDIAITLTDNSQLKASLARATKAKESPDYTGTEVLRGTVVGPIVGVALREEEAEDGE